MGEKIFFPNSTQFDKMNENLEKIAAAVGSQVDTSTWAGIQKVVRAGLAPDLLPIGTQLKVNHSVYGEHLFDVVAHDYLQNAHDPDAHTMTIMQHDLLKNIQFDEMEAFYFAEDELPAGTYNFTISANAESWRANTYQFTLTSPVPQGGVLSINPDMWSSLTSHKVWAYDSPSEASPAQKLAISVGNDGTSLGTLGQGGLNTAERVGAGSNNYKESAIRQFLNSSAAAGGAWKPQTKFDMRPTWMGTTAGYVAGLDQDFLATVVEVNVPCVANNTYEAPDSTTKEGERYTVQDRFYLASYIEVFGATSGSTKDGSTQFPFFVGATAADKVKYSNGIGSSWVTRTPQPNAWEEMSVSSAGAKTTLICYLSTNAFSPCCTIG